MERTQSWAAAVLMVGVSVFDASQAHLLPPVSPEAGDPLTGGCRSCDVGELPGEDLGYDDVECPAEVHKQYAHVPLWGVEVMQDVVQGDVDCIINRPDSHQDLVCTHVSSQI